MNYSQARPLPSDKAREVFGNAETGWVPTGRDILLETVNIYLDRLTDDQLKVVYRMCGCDHEPEDWEDRVQAGLEPEPPHGPEDL